MVGTATVNELRPNTRPGLGSHDPDSSVLLCFLNGIDEEQTKRDDAQLPNLKYLLCGVEKDSRGNFSQRFETANPNRINTSLTPDYKKTQVATFY